MRFGILSPPSEGEFHGAIWGGHRYDIIIGPQRTALVRDGQLRFEANAGVVVRTYQTEANRISFSLTSERGARVTIAEFSSGEFQVKIDGKAAGKLNVTGGRLNFEVPPGEHRVELRNN